jgi:hypothetical protein
MTTPIKCHSERKAKNLSCGDLAEKPRQPTKMSHYQNRQSLAVETAME